jgi:molybdate transport system ATP-binding protein
MADELICRCRKRLPSGFQIECDLAIPLGASPVTVLFGPSGSGKTTLLRMIAGLDQPDAGEVSFRGRSWNGLVPQQRRTGFLFQDYALFPHLTVAENVAFAANRAKSEKAIDAFGLRDVVSQKPRSLSGGQQQRVALARAIAAEPAILLLDEPLSALDSPTRAAVRRQLRRMLLDGGRPAIVVTHDRMEAIALGDSMAVMIGGRVRQFGPVQQIFRCPADAEIAAAVGMENVLRAEIVARDAGLVTITIGGAHLEAIDSGEGGLVYACIHAEEIALSHEGPRDSSVRNRVRGAVQSVVREGPLARVELDCGFPLVAVITAHSAAELKLNSGDIVFAVLKATSVHLTSVEGGL